MCDVSQDDDAMVGQPRGTRAPAQFDMQYLFRLYDMAVVQVLFRRTVTGILCMSKVTARLKMAPRRRVG